MPCFGTILGIETFNFFCADAGIHTGGGQPARYPALRGLHDLGTLRGKPKHYTLATRPGFYEFPLFEFAEQLPATVEARGWKAFRIAMCAEPPGITPELVIQLVLSTPMKGTIRRRGQEPDQLRNHQAIPRLGRFLRRDQLPLPRQVVVHQHGPSRLRTRHPVSPLEGAGKMIREMPVAPAP